MSSSININDYTYNLPEDRIALHPAPQRDQSKLLFYNKGEIEHRRFTQITDLLPVNSLLVMNNTKVIPARLLFRKSTGATIEVFLLEPIEPSVLVQEAMTARSSAVWKCAVGNLKRWTSETVLESRLENLTLTAELIDRSEQLVRLSWTGPMTFAEVIEAIGKTPLPPYIHRASDEEDKDRYQTVYACNEGAVAAPTAGLHFTEDVLHSLKSRNITTAEVTLHVGAGTFMPVKTDDALEHTMHQEQIIVRKDLVEQLLSAPNIIAVGTTSVRVLESIYWFGCKLDKDPEAAFTISQTDAYGPVEPIALDASLANVLKRLDASDWITGHTSIYIHPGYEFRVCDALITNFHQPGSTLILLIAAFIGGNWRRVYDEALANNYRFLSYGDSSLLVP